MCGFAGFLTGSRTAADAGAVLRCMTDAVAHRGPDDSGQWCDAGAGVALGHRRLSILDLSPEGHQPMASASGRFVVVYNGEVYNFARVRRELEPSGHSFRGHSDTEVLLAAVERWGLVEAVRRFTGMFSFALWDREERALHLVRDRLGEKPLYYGWTGPTFVFGSELKALRAHPDWRGEVDRAAVALLLQYSYIPAPRSIYHGIRKAVPGTILTLRAGSAPGTEPEPTVYWSAREVAERALRDPLRVTADEATDQLEALLGEVVRDEMVADVPLGAFLSGGIDSSTIVALMQRASTRPVRTFTIGFNEPGYDEAAHARAVAAHLGTEHTELYVTAEEALAVVPALPSMYDEPFADSSQIPTFLVAQMARRHVTVSLSGDGGDELFGGYARYFWAERAWRGLSRVPLPVRRLVAGGIDTVPPHRWNSLVDTLSAALPPARRPRQFGERLHRAGRMLRATSHAAVYDDLLSLWPEPQAVALGGASRERHALAGERAFRAPDRLHEMMLLDTVTYLPDDILVKVDRASMAVSLECRAPMLDHRVAEFAWRLPLGLKVRGSQGKWLLRQLLYRHVPRELVDRPKMGFSVPLDAWLRGPLREWAAALLDPARLRREGFFDADAVTRAWDDHVRRRVSRQARLWPVLMFQAWLEQRQ